MDDAASLHEQLIRLSNHYGSQVEHARAGGGNASVKHDGVLHIKPSGTTLAGLRAEDLVPLRVDVLLEALASDAVVEGDQVTAAANAARVGEPDGRRPSVEILFHALLPEALVLHLHPLVANAVTCNRHGRRLAQQMFGDDVVWVDYIDPGVPLARGIDAARREHAQRTGRPAPATILLGNHGIIVAGDSSDEVSSRIDHLTSTIRAAIDAAPESRRPPAELVVDVDALAAALHDATGATGVAISSDEFTRSNAVVAAGPVCHGPLIPDQVVYAGSLPVHLPDDPAGVATAVEQFHTRHDRLPVTAVVPGQAAFAVGDSSRAARNALDTFLDALRVARDADRIGEVRVMDELERHFIENWEAESYRRQVAAEG